LWRRREYKYNKLLYVKIPTFDKKTFKFNVFNGFTNILTFI